MLRQLMRRSSPKKCRIGEDAAFGFSE